MSVSRIAAVIFDMDGVVTRTAALHATARKMVFDELLQMAIPLIRRADLAATIDSHRSPGGGSCGTTAADRRSKATAPRCQS
jgi:hypothetical protein